MTDILTKKDVLDIMNNRLLITQQMIIKNGKGCLFVKNGILEKTLSYKAPSGNFAKFSVSDVMHWVLSGKEKYTLKETPSGRNSFAYIIEKQCV